MLLAKAEHDASGHMGVVRTHLHKIWGPGISGRSHFGSPHRALYHDMLSAAQSADSSSIERCLQFKMPSLAGTAAWHHRREAIECCGCPSATAHNTSPVENGVTTTSTDVRL